MTVAIVVPLEVIDVDHQQTQFAAASDGRIPCGREPAVERTAIQHAGQRVVKRHVFKLTAGHQKPLVLARGLANPLGDGDAEQ